jgi:L-threonylcarbamoyladenylate synthase
VNEWRATTRETRAPGTLPTHYAPVARVVLTSADELGARAAALLGDGHRVGVLAPGSVASGLSRDLVVLDPPADAEEYARTLYARLREADRRALDVLLVVPPDDRGIGAAVVDRLRRASAR